LFFEVNHRGHTHIDDSSRKKCTVRHSITFVTINTPFFSSFFLMDTPEQETPRHKSMKSELISHQLQLACKKNRSNSVNGDREHEEK